jgi:YD repeat-containing protein
MKDKSLFLLKVWRCCCGAVCGAPYAVKISTKAILEDWKRNSILICCVIAGVATLLVGNVAEATPDTNVVIPIDLGGNETCVNGINNNGQIVGVVGDSVDSKKQYKGFFCDDIHCTLPIFLRYPDPDPPHSIALQTYPQSINDNGQIVGWWEHQIDRWDEETKSWIPTYETLGFIYTNGNWITLNYPGAHETKPTGINDSGQIVGTCSNSGFLYSNGNWTILNFPGAYETIPNGINERGQIVGRYRSHSNDGAFLYTISTGTYTAITVDIEIDNALSINNIGHILIYSHLGARFSIYDIGTKRIFLFDDGSKDIKDINDSGHLVGCSFVSTLSVYSPQSLGNPPICETLVGNPINTATGNKLQVETDFVGSPNTFLELRRIYNSSDTAVTAFGSNWRSTWDRSIIKISPTSVKVTRADGRADTFTLKELTDSSGIWQSTPDITSQLTSDLDEKMEIIGWQLLNDDDSKEYYTSDGRLLSITTRAGLVTTLTYNANNNLAKVTGPFGHTLSFVYDSLGHITQLIPPDGNVYGYAYDDNNNLISVTYPDGTSRQFLYGYYSSYTYFPHALTGIIDENGNRFATYTYDGRRAISSNTSVYSSTRIDYNDSDGTATVTDANGNIRSYNFINQFGVTKPTTVNNKGCACGSSSYTYDANGFIASRTDFNGNITTYEHDARGLELSRREAQGTQQERTITTQWHAIFHLPVKITEPNRTTTFSYDGKGNLLEKTITAGTMKRIWTYTYNTKGQVLTIDGPRTDVKDVSRFSYDAQGNLSTIQNALGHVTSITSYDANGRPLSIRIPSGLVINFKYNARGRLISRTEGTKVTSYTYDDVGNLIKITFPDKSYLTGKYDEGHRLISVTDMDGNRIDYTLDGMGNRLREILYLYKLGASIEDRKYEYDSLNRLSKVLLHGWPTSYGYDNNDNLIDITDSLGNKTNNDYDALNRLIQVTDSNDGVTHFSYDSNDRNTRIVDPVGLITSYLYDGLDNILSIKSPDMGTTTNVYDAAGNVISSTDALGRKTTYTYDALNRCTKAIFDDGKTITYGYDQGPYGIGHLTEMTDPSGTTTWSYNKYGKVIKKQQRTDETTLTMKTSYDSAGRISRITYPSGQRIAYDYDAAGRLNMVYVNGKEFLLFISYYPFSSVTTGWCMGNNINRSTSWAEGILSGIMIYRNGDDPWRNPSKAKDKMGLTYEAANRITAILDAAGNSKVFEYDATGQLTHYTSGATSQTYSYDPNGNRLSLSTNEGVTNYEYSIESNKLLGLSGLVSQENAYNEAGSLTGDGLRTYIYDARGRLVQVTMGSTTIQYAINGLGQRVAKSGASISSGVTNFFYDETGHLIGEYDATGKAVQETVWLHDMPVGVLKSRSTGFCG